VRLLVDTHVWLWFFLQSGRLGKEAREALTSGTTAVFLSSVSAVEIAIKWSLGRLPLPAPPSEFVPKRAALAGHESLPFTQAHALALAELPWLHKDPFDRMLVAQARAEGLTLVTADEMVRQYAVPILWAA
jgi:PIN domain nuclease of toxin-antitoxin system